MTHHAIKIQSPVSTMAVQANTTMDGYPSQESGPIDGRIMMPHASMIPPASDPVVGSHLHGYA